jgi:DNA-binding response OmpR family regulator
MMDVMTEKTHFASVLRPLQPKGLSGLVLLAEDEPMVRRMLRRMLERFGLTVVEARDGVETLELFARFRNEVSVVLLDWTMPRMAGEETLRELRHRSDVPVVVLSGHSPLMGMDIAMDEIQGFIQKPFRGARLEASLREVLA